MIGIVFSFAALSGMLGGLLVVAAFVEYSHRRK